MTRSSIEDFEAGLRDLSLRTRLPLGVVTGLLGDIAGVLLQEARETIFEDGEEVTFDAHSIRDELIRMGHDGTELPPARVRLLLDFFLRQVIDPEATRN